MKVNLLRLTDVSSLWKKFVPPTNDLSTSLHSCPFLPLGLFVGLGFRQSFQMNRCFFLSFKVDFLSKRAEFSARRRAKWPTFFVSKSHRLSSCPLAAIFYKGERQRLDDWTCTSRCLKRSRAEFCLKMIGVDSLFSVLWRSLIDHNSKNFCLTVANLNFIQSNSQRLVKRFPIESELSVERSVRLSISTDERKSKVPRNRRRSERRRVERDNWRTKICTELWSVRWIASSRERREFDRWGSTRPSTKRRETREKIGSSTQRPFHLNSFFTCTNDESRTSIVNRINFDRKQILQWSSSHSIFASNESKIFMLFCPKRRCREVLIFNRIGSEERRERSSNVAKRRSYRFDLTKSKGKSRSDRLFVRCFLSRIIAMKKLKEKTIRSTRIFSISTSSNSIFFSIVKFATCRNFQKTNYESLTNCRSTIFHFFCPTSFLLHSG